VTTVMALKIEHYDEGKLRSYLLAADVLYELRQHMDPVLATRLEAFRARLQDIWADRTAGRW
jgi:hypothetical protein